jgi:DNA polymerase III subunit epsilon
MYAIIDIETTGISHKFEKITEIAIFVHDGTRVTEEYSTLINPECTIPYYITKLTGISNEMVADAPKFYEVAKRVVELTNNNIFVAHNVNFDYRFIREEYLRLGYHYKRDVLCTVKMSRKLIPGKRSYSLGNLCLDLGIHVQDRHRATGDARATVKLFELLLSKNGGLLNPASSYVALNQDNKYPVLDIALISGLSHDAGVFYFLNEQGDIIYVGNGADIQDSVLSVLKKGSLQKNLDFRAQVVDIGYDITGSELVSCILALQQVKKYMPVFNQPKIKNEQLTLGYDSFWAIDRGRNAEEHSVIRIKNGQYMGFGYIDKDIQLTDSAMLDDYIKLYPDSNEIQYLIRKYIKTHPGIKVIWE